MEMLESFCELLFCELVLRPAALIVHAQADQKSDDEYPEQYLRESRQGAGGFTQAHESHQDRGHYKCNRPPQHSHPHAS